MTRFVAVGAVIAIGQSERVEAQHFAAIAHDIDAVAFHRCGRTDAHARLVPVNAVGELGYDELPEELATPFVEAHQYAAVAFVLWVTRVAVVGADIDAAACDDGRGMSLRAELR